MAQLVRSQLGPGDRFEGLVEFVRDGVGGGDGVLAGRICDVAVAAGGADELLDGPAGPALDPPGDGQGGEDDRQMASMESRLRW